MFLKWQVVYKIWCKFMQDKQIILNGHLEQLKRTLKGITSG